MHISISVLLFRSNETTANAGTQCGTQDKAQNTDESLLPRDEAELSANIERRKRGYWRRMLCATVPLQAVFLSSLFLSWALDPELMGNNCESGASNLANILYPQLRYVNGPPPI